MDVEFKLNLPVRCGEGHAREDPAGLGWMVGRKPYVPIRSDNSIAAVVKPTRLQVRVQEGLRACLARKQSGGARGTHCTERMCPQLGQLISIQIKATRRVTRLTGTLPCDLSLSSARATPETRAMAPRSEQSPESIVNRVEPRKSIAIEPLAKLWLTGVRCVLDDEVGEKMGRGAPAGNFGVDDGKPPPHSTTLTRPSATQQLLLCFLFNVHIGHCTIMYNRRRHNGYRGSLNYQSVFCYPSLSISLRPNMYTKSICWWP